jgi:DNA polymerase (family 10)
MSAPRKARERGRATAARGRAPSTCAHRLQTARTTQFATRDANRCRPRAPPLAALRLQPHATGVQDPAGVGLALDEMAALLALEGEPKFKVRAYEHAARVAKLLGPDLGPLVEQGRLRSVQGIGAALSQQIEELWNTGSSEYLQRLRHALPPGAAELVRVPGMTRRRMQTLHAALGIQSVADLRSACAEGRVRAIAGFGEKIERRLLEGCDRCLPAGKESTPPSLVISAACELARSIEQELWKVTEEVQLAGALRRGHETVSELEFAVRPHAGPALEQLAGLRQMLRVDRARCSAQTSEGLTVQLHGGQASFGNALFLATGNVAHVQAVSELAARRGFALCPSGSGYGPEAAASALPVREFRNETELYGAVGLSLVPPELRQGAGELEEAARSDFCDLLSLKDVRGMVHCHTTYSDGKHSVLEMARAAHALGMEYITITDHSPSAHYARGVALDRLRQQWDEIDAAQSQVPIRILRGTESDILAQGLLDYPDAVLEQLDVVIASVHARHGASPSEMTERLRRVLSLPIFKIWGHPLGRILRHRAPIECDVLAVLDALASSRGAIEINADPHRLDLPPSWLPAARARGIPFVVSVDAHSTSGFDVLRYGVTMARRGGVQKAEVLNARSAASFAASVKPAP